MTERPNIANGPFLLVLGLGIATAGVLSGLSSLFLQGFFEPFRDRLLLAGFLFALIGLGLAYLALIKGEPESRNTQYSNTALIFGLLCLIPLFNLLSSPLSIVFGIMALRKSSKEPKKYGGTIRAIIGLVLGILTILAAIYGYFLFGNEIFLRQ